MKRVKTDGPQPSVQISKGFFVAFGTHPPTVFKAEGFDVKFKLLGEAQDFDFNMKFSDPGRWINVNIFSGSTVRAYIEIRGLNNNRD